MAFENAYELAKAAQREAVIEEAEQRAAKVEKDAAGLRDWLTQLLGSPLNEALKRGDTDVGPDDDS